MRARELNPLDSLALGMSAQSRPGARRSGRDHVCRRAISSTRSFWIGYIQLGQAYASAASTTCALEAFADSERRARREQQVPVDARSTFLARMGRAAAAREVITALAHPSPPRYVPPVATALVYAGLGDREAMFGALEQAYAARDVHLMYLPVDMKWDPYRTDPRFVDLLARCRFEGPR